MLKFIRKITFCLFIILFLTFSLSAASFAEIGILKSNSSSIKYTSLYLGEYKKLFEEFEQTFKNTNLKYRIVSDDDIKHITKDHYSVLVMPLTVDIPENALKGIENFIKDGGKIVVIYPEDIDTPVVRKLAELSGVKLKGRLNFQNDTYLNWLGNKAIKENEFPSDSKFSAFTLQHGSKMLAVWGQSEENISAATVCPNGGYIGWKLGNEGNIGFNSTFMTYFLDSLSPGILKSEQIKFNTREYQAKINEIEKFRIKTHNLIDTSVTPGEKNNLSEIHEYLYLSKLNEKLANSSFKDYDYDKVLDYLKESRTNALNAYIRAVPSSLVEARTLWLDRGTIVSVKNPKEMSILFDRIEKTGINVVYLETINAGFTIYPSSIGTQNPLTKGWDPLYYAIKEAHKRNIELHAWCWIFAVGNTRHNPLIYKPYTYPGPILERNPDWALKGKNGNLIPTGQHEYWLDPSNYQVRNYLKNLLKEITFKYNVDGIQLDYIRYPFQRSNNLMGYNPESAKKFEIETGYSLKDLNGETIRAWNNWKSRQISTFVRDVSETLTKIKSDLVISAAVFGGSRQTRLNSIQQEWEIWVNNGWIDVLNPMIYANSPKQLTDNLSYIVKAVDKKAFVYPGIAVRQLEIPDLLEQIYVVNEMGLNGTTIFAMAHLGMDKSKLLSTGPFRYRDAQVPSKNPTNSARLLIEEFLYRLNDMQSSDNFRKSKYGDIALAQAALIHNEISIVSKNKDVYSLNRILDTLEYLTQIMNLWENEQISSVSAAHIRYINRYLKDAGSLLTFEQHKLSMKEYR